MTERKPIGMSFESWVDKAIREAEERGEFSDLPGAGKPIPGAGQPDDELWWVQTKLRREKLTFIPPSLALRKDVEEIDDRAAAQRSEADVRRLVDELNSRIVAANRTGIAGPPVTLLPLDPERVLATRRDRSNAVTQPKAAGDANPADMIIRPARRGLFRWRRHR